MPTRLKDQAQLWQCLMALSFRLNDGTALNITYIQANAVNAYPPYIHRLVRSPGRDCGDNSISPYLHACPFAGPKPGKD